MNETCFNQIDQSLSNLLIASVNLPCSKKWRFPGEKFEGFLFPKGANRKAAFGAIATKATVPKIPMIIPKAYGMGISNDVK